MAGPLTAVLCRRLILRVPPVSCAGLTKHICCLQMDYAELICILLLCTAKILLRLGIEVGASAKMWDIKIISKL